MSYIKVTVIVLLLSSIFQMIVIAYSFYLYENETILVRIVRVAVAVCYYL